MTRRASRRQRPAGRFRALTPIALALAAGCGLNPPLRLDRVEPSATAVELAAVPFHPQQAHHCGPASLLTVLEHSGVATGYDEVVRRVYLPGLRGSLQVEMLAAARGLGRIAYRLPPEPAAVLAEIRAGRPVLVLLNLGVPSAPVWHYAVVVGFDPRRNRFVLRSGDRPRSVQRAPAWLRRWDWGGRWAAVLLRPGEWPATARRESLLEALADFEDAADPAAAERAWRSAAEHWPEEPIAWLGLGNAAHRLERWEAARAAYGRALALEPERLAARLNLALTFAEEELPCEGLEVLGPAPAAEHPLRPAFLELEDRLRDGCDAANDSAAPEVGDSPAGPQRSHPSTDKIATRESVYSWRGPPATPPAPGLSPRRGHLPHGAWSDAAAAVAGAESLHPAHHRPRRPSLRHGRLPLRVPLQPLSGVGVDSRGESTQNQPDGN